MSIIINDFEIVLESEQEQGATGQQEAQGGAGLTPLDIRDVLDRQVERMARVRAD